MTNQRRPFVCMIQLVMKQYRIPFFIELEKELLKDGIRLHVVYGKPWAEEAQRADHAELPGPLGLEVPTFRFFQKLYLQWTFLPWLHADLVVIEPANKHLLNYLLMFLQLIRLKQIAYYGHGYDRQTDPFTLSNRFKRQILHCATWWFAYTRGVADYVARQGFDPRRITAIGNAVDTRVLRAQLASISTEDVEKMKVSLGFDAGARVGIFCGSLYTNKKIDLLLASAQLIHEKDPSFRLLILGGGELENDVRVFAKDNKWVRYEGPIFGHRKAVLLKIAEVWLNPGLVGLGILDGFCAGLPIITTTVDVHSPEVEYLEDGINGLIVAPEASTYASAVLKLLYDSSLLTKLQQGALESSNHYNIETMAANFADGIKRCLLGRV